MPFGIPISISRILGMTDNPEDIVYLDRSREKGEVYRNFVYEFSLRFLPIGLVLS